MAFFKTLLVAYILGGLTFIPLVIVAVAALVWYTSPEVSGEGTSQNGEKASLDPATAETKQRHKTSTRIYRSGWVTVRRTFEPVADTGNDAGYMTMMATSYRSFVDSRSKDPRKSRPRDKYYAVLKDTVLFLYEDEQENDCFAAIKLPLHEIVIYPEDLIEGELFMKKNAICLKPILKAGEEVSEEAPSLILRPTPIPANTSGGATSTTTETVPDLSYLPWFIFPSINHDKEDWYHSLIAGSKLTRASELAKDASLFDSNDMGSLVDAIDDQPDPIPTRWLNAMIGRLFFSVYRTSAVESYIVRKIMRKLAKVNKPDFLGDIEVKEVDVGRATPFFSKPMLKELTAEGDASMEVHVKYAGDLRIAISTTATLNLGQRFKSYSVKLVLAVILKDLEGNLLFKVKKPPSNRIWFGFTSPPKLGLRIEPVVSTRQIKWSLVTKPIESRLRELVAESIVLPHMDDIAFFDTKAYSLRGGIYGECVRHASDLRAEVGDGMEPALDMEEGHIPPGVPNVKLGDPKLPSEDSLRQRHGRPRKSSTSDSLVSTKSVPVPLTGGSDKASAFDLTSRGTSMSTEHPSVAMTTHKQKDNDHSRKKSWFSSSTPTAKAGLPATRSDSALPFSTNHGSDAEHLTSAQPPNQYQDPVLSTPSSSDSQAAASDSGEAAVLKLKEILRAGKQQSSSSDNSVSSTLQSQSTPSLTSLPGGEGLCASPEPSLYKTGSGSSAGTAHAKDADSASIGSYRVPSHKSSSSKLSDKLRRKSDKSIAPPIPSAPASLHSGQDATSMIDASVPGHSDSASTQTNSSATSPNIAILQNWKTKATDKQAIQAGVSQARDAMSKLGSRWQAYRQAQQASTEAEKQASMQVPTLQDDTNKPAAQQPLSAAKRLVSEYQDGSSIPSPSPVYVGKQDGNLTPENRSRSSSLVSTSPKLPFQPSPATTTTSLSRTSGSNTPTIASIQPATEQAIQPSPTLRRVPPPSAVQVHPAVGAEPERAAPPKRKSYTPAPRMSIPGIDDSRRFHVSSADFVDPKASPPPLPLREPVDVEVTKQPLKRVPAPGFAQGVNADPSAATDQSADSAVSTGGAAPPPLPPRQVVEDDAATTESASLDEAASTAEPPYQQGSSSAPSGVAAREAHATAAEESSTSPEVLVHPPTPSPSHGTHSSEIVQQ